MTSGSASARVSLLGSELHAALRGRRTVEPLTSRFADLKLEEAYQISQHLLAQRLREGEKLVGRKIGVTSAGVQRALDVHQPDFGYLTDAMVLASGADVAVTERLIQPRAEAEIAFRMGKPLRGPAVTGSQVLAAIEYAVPCLEIVDSRIRDWKIRIEDTVADNASCGLVVVGHHAVDPRTFDLSLVGCVVEKNGKLLHTGAGAATLGSPLNSVAWLVNTLSTFGEGLSEGDLVLSGALVPLEPVVAGDLFQASIDRIGSVAVRFT